MSANGTKEKDKIRFILGNIKYVLKRGIIRNRGPLYKITTYLLVICLSLMAWILLSLHDDLATCFNSLNDVNTRVASVTHFYRETLLERGYEVTRLHSQALRDKISESLRSAYASRQSQLKQDLDTYLSENSVSNEVYMIFSTVSREYLNTWYPKSDRVRVIITDKKNILYTSSRTEPMRKAGNTPPELFEDTPNGRLLISNDTGSITKTRLPDLADDISKLSHSSILAASYIYDHEDIFGTPNIYPNGQPVDNYELAVVFLYMPFERPSLKMINDFRDSLESIRDYSCAEMLESKVGVIIWLLILASLCSFFRHKLEHVKEEQTEGKDANI